MTDSLMIKKNVQLYKEYLLPMLSLVLVLFLLPFQIIPTLQKISGLREEIHQGTVRNQQMKEKLTVLTSENTDSLRPLLDKVNQAIPSNKDIPSIFSAISTVAVNTTMAIGRVQVVAGSVGATMSAKPLNSKTNPNLIEFQATVIGDFEHTRNFISEIEKANRFFRIRSVAIHQTQKENVFQTSSTLLLYAFYQPLPDSIGKIDEPLQLLTEDEKDRIASLPDFQLSADYSLPLIPTGKTDPFSQL